MTDPDRLPPILACGCQFLVSVTSAGQILAQGETPYFVLIDRALRDEGTSYHYLAPSEFAEADLTLVAAALEKLKGAGQPIYRGAAWTTDAPFRETEAAKGGAVLCACQQSDAVESDDFEKGDAHGSAAALAVIAAAARGWRRARQAAGPG